MPSDLIAFNYNAQFCDVYNYRIGGDVAATLNAQSGAPNHSGPKTATANTGSPPDAY